MQLKQIRKATPDLDPMDIRTSSGESINAAGLPVKSRLFAGVECPDSQGVAVRDKDSNACLKQCDNGIYITQHSAPESYCTSRGV